MVSDSRILILSQDYELFFRRSGSVEHCLIEPCNALLSTAKTNGVKITFFVDVGMILCMNRYSASSSSVTKMAGQVKEHLASLSAAGHELALHVHPHWEDTAWRDGQWDFTGARYQLNCFSQMEILDIFVRYSACLAEITGQNPTAFRAGGFCLEPFSQISAALNEVGITVDSSIVPGTVLKDGTKGYDFRNVPAKEWWQFDGSPKVPQKGGPFLELPISATLLPFSYYWSRMLTKFRGTQMSTVFGDGASTAIGVGEIVRRLAGRARAVEMSIDDPKIGSISGDQILGSSRRLWQFMGHPKLLSKRSLGIFEELILQVGFNRYETVTSTAQLIRSEELKSG